MKAYAVLDTNVLVSSLISGNPEAATVQVVTRMLAGEITLVYSEAILQEYEEVLSRKKFGIDGAVIAGLMEAIRTFGISVIPTDSGVTLPDMDDVPFYEVVLETRDEGAYLVTGNKKHFPKETFIVTAREFIDILDQG